MAYEPSIGDVVTFDLWGELCSGEVLNELPSGTVGVRITELGHELYGQTIYFNRGALSPASFKER